MSRTIPIICWMTCVLLLLSSCAKDDGLKDPCPVQVRFALNSAGVGGSDRLELTEGYLVLSEIEVTGERVEGETFNFVRTFPSGLTCEFGASQPLEDLLFDLPQGDYTSLNIAFKTLDNGPAANWVVQGHYDYMQANQGSAWVDIAWRDSKRFERTVHNHQNQTQFALGEAAQTITLTIQPKLWFRDVSEIKLEQARCTTEPRGLVMLIDPTSNNNMFQSIDALLGTTLTATL